MGPISTPSWSAIPPFDTLQDCLEHIRNAHPQEYVTAGAKAIGTNQPIQALMPSFLYRGEVGWFPRCTSRMERVRRGDFPGVTPQLLQSIFVDLDNEMQARLNIDQMLSAGLLQHYGFPTELMDGSASLETAAIFSRYESGNIDMGAIAVFDIKVLSNNSIVVDLSSHPRAVRPRRQRAYGICHRQHVDLKDSQAIKDMGITWYTYRSDPLKVERVTRGIGLLSVADDETAGILRLWLDGSIAKLNKGFDLLLMPAVTNVISIPTKDTNRIIVADVLGVLHFRIFDADDKRVVDTDENQLPGKASEIAGLKTLLTGFWGVAQLPASNKDGVITAFTSLFDHTLNKVADPVARYLAVRIAHCPMITRVLSWRGPGQPKQVKLVSSARARFVIDENKEISDSIRLWSQSFPHVTKRPDPVF